MVNLDKDIEGKIEEIIGKYQKREAKLLNYLIVDDEITFFLPLSDDEKISDEDKDEFRKGRTYPYLNQSLLNIINKRMLTLNDPLFKPRKEQLNFQLLSFKFRDSQLNRCPKISFQQNYFF